VREQRLDLGERGGGGQVGEDVSQVGRGLERVRLGTLDERVEIRAGFGAARGVGEEPVLAT
jgi:hypothetical protein